MKKKVLIAGLAVLVLLLTGCAQKAADKPAVSEATAPVQQPPLNPATMAPLPEDIDPTAEEGKDR